MALLLVGTSWRALGPVAARMFEGLHRGPLSGEPFGVVGPGFWVALALWGGAAWASTRERGHAICASLPLVSAYVITHHVFEGSVVWAGAYRGVALSLATVVLVGALPRLRGRWLGPALGLLLLLSGVRAATEQTTEQMEYRWLRPHLKALEEGARVAYVGRAGPRVLFLPEHLVPGWSCGATSGLRIGQPAMLTKGLSPGEHRYYLRSSLCSSSQGRDLCASVERDAHLTEVATSTFPAIASLKSLSFDAERVEVTLYRVEGARTR